MNYQQFTANNNTGKLFKEIRQKKMPGIIFPDFDPPG